MAVTRRQAAVAKKPRLKLKARAYRPIYHTMRGKKSYKAGNILKELAIGKTSWVGAKKGMPYRRYRYVTSGPTGQIEYGPKNNRRDRPSTTRLVSRRCESENECKDWAGKYGGKMTYIKYGKKKFYKNSYALDTRKTYNKAEPSGLGFIQSYRKARAKYAQQQQRRAAAQNAVRRRSIRLQGKSPPKNATKSSPRLQGSKKRKRTNVDPKMIISGPRKRVQTKR